jgi:hypothetical protein
LVNREPRNGVLGLEMMKRGRRGVGVRVAPSPRWGDEGVASTVGTIMALMVFMALLSMFTNQYVPVWMEDNEAKHMNQVESQMGMLKHGIDTQILVGQLGGAMDISVYSPITLGSEGVPMFAALTQGYLDILPDKGRTSVSFVFDADKGTGATLVPISSNSSGSIAMEAPNRYYVSQILTYENDAIILKQGDGIVMKSIPQFSVRQEGSSYRVSFTQVTLYGANKSYSGTGTTGIHTSLRYTNSTTYTNLTSDINITISSTYASAWAAYFNDYLPKTGLAVADYTVIATATHTYLELNMGRFSSMTLNQAHFDVLMGEVGV